MILEDLAFFKLFKNLNELNIYFKKIGPEPFSKNLTFFTYSTKLKIKIKILKIFYWIKIL